MSAHFIHDNKDPLDDIYAFKDGMIVIRRIITIKQFDTIYHVGILFHADDDTEPTIKSLTGWYDRGKYSCRIETVEEFCVGQELFYLKSPK